MAREGERGHVGEGRGPCRIPHAENRLRGGRPLPRGRCVEDDLGQPPRLARRGARDVRESPRTDVPFLILRNGWQPRLLCRLGVGVRRKRDHVDRPGDMVHRPVDSPCPLLAISKHVRRTPRMGRKGRDRPGRRHCPECFGVEGRRPALSRNRGALSGLGRGGPPVAILVCRKNAPIGGREGVQGGAECTTGRF